MDRRNPLSSSSRGARRLFASPATCVTLTSSVIQAYVREWTALAMTETGGARHAKLAYQDDGSWGTLCA